VPCPNFLHPQKRLLVPIVQNAGWALGLVWMCGEKRICLASTGVSEAGTVQPVAVSAVPTVLSWHPDIGWKAILTWILRIFLR